jgi:predicted ATP-grasp superfamily ATP-dependent carboligase
MARQIKYHTKQNKVLVLDGMWNKTLAVVRSLGQKEFHVTAGEWTRFAAALFSRYCDRKVVYPSPVLTPEKFIVWLTTEIKTNRYDVVLPTELNTQMLLARNRSTIEKYTRLPFADHELTSQIQDKAWLMNYAVSNNIPCPDTLFPETPDSLESMNNNLKYPLVIKPRVSSGSRGIVYVKKADDLLESYRTVHRKYPNPIVQEFIPNGGAFGVGALLNFQSKPRASFVYRRLREYPVSGGPSTLRESVKNEEIRHMALEILESLKWTGLAMVEFRVDARDGKPKLLEINPRLWGSLWLAIRSGVDFPYLLYKMALDGDVGPRHDYRPGVKCRWLIPGDLLHFLHNPERFKMSPGFFSNEAEDDILSFDDPMPTLGRISSLFPLMYKREMREILF